MRSSGKIAVICILLGLALPILLGVTGRASAADWFVAPLGAKTQPVPAGSNSDPFPTVDAAVKSGKVKGGDRILMMDGPHGKLVISGAKFDTPVTIMSQNKKRAHVDSILLRDASRNVILSNLKVWPTDPDKGEMFLVRSYANTSYITIKNLIIRSDRDAGRFMDWDATKWNARRYSGIMLQGSHNTVNRNTLTGVYFGITISGSDSRVSSNVVNGFNGDGLQSTGNNNVFRFNRVFNCVATDGNHDDGFQSWAVSGGSIQGLVLEGNAIFEWTGQPNHPLRCQLQGIGMFGGFYDDVVINNNLISTTAYHGITVLGARRATIANNTIVNGRGLTATYPWLSIGNHKNGTPPTDVLVANNLAMGYLGTSDAERHVEFRWNSVIGSPGAVFQSPLLFDYRPKVTSGYIDTAGPNGVPKRDIMNQRRPGGALPDRGAYEVQVDSASASMQTLLQSDDGLDGEQETATTRTDTTGAKWIKILGMP